MEILSQLNPAQIAILSVIVAGVTELYGRVTARDYRAAGKIVVAVVTGTLIALSWGLAFVAAVAVGFVAPGGIAVVGSIGKKSQATPTPLITKA